MDKRILSTEILSEEDGGKVKNVLITEIFYTKGGMNYATSKMEERGYYLLVRPERQESREDNIVIRSFMAFSGVKAFISGAKRFSQKTLDNFTLDPAFLTKLRAQVLEQMTTK